jgi:hypothetical protein
MWHAGHMPGAMMICCPFQKRTLMDGMDGALPLPTLWAPCGLWGSRTGLNKLSITLLTLISPFRTLPTPGEKYPVLVEKAQDLADQMAYAWVGDQSIPYGYIDFTNQQPTMDTSNIAEAGTLTMEWNRLSQYTGNHTYQTLAEKSVQHMIHMSTPLPGMPAQGINPKTVSHQICSPYKYRR